MRSSAVRILAVALLCAGLAGCHLSTAVARSGDIAKRGWDFDRYGLFTPLTGVGTTFLAGLDLLVHAFLPIDLDGYFLRRDEPEHKWYRAYRGPMLPLSRVGVLCKTKRTIHITAIQGSFDGVSREARHEAWHFPDCIEAVPGRYRLTIQYYSRKHYDTNSEIATFTTESTTPAELEWAVLPGAVYTLDARLGDIRPAPDTVPPGSTVQTVPKSKHKMGTSRFLLDVGEWLAIVEQVPSFDAIDAPVLEYRAAWERWEGERR